MSFVFTQLQDLDSLGPAPGHKLAAEKGFPWPRVHCKPGAIIMSKLLGSGTFGNVVQATVIPDDRSMLSGALKLAAACRRARRALSRELEAYARLADQRDIPRVLAWAATDDGAAVAAILFDTLPGTLADEIALRLHLRAATDPALPHPTRDAPLYTPHEYWPLIHTLAALLSVAHARGIVHADVKPANILLDADRNPKLADWGIFLDAPAGGGPGVAAGDFRTIRGPHGTAGYCLPELSMAGEAVAVHPSIDSQALALTVVEMLLGMLPEHAREVHAAGELGEFLPPGDDRLRALILGTLRAAPEERTPLSTWLAERSRAHCVPEARIECMPDVLARFPRAGGSAAGSACAHQRSAGNMAGGEGVMGWGPSSTSGACAETDTNASSQHSAAVAASRGSLMDSGSAASMRSHGRPATSDGCTFSDAASSRKASFLLPPPASAGPPPAASSAPADALSLALSRPSTAGYGGAGRPASAGGTVRVTTNPCFADGTGGAAGAGERLLGCAAGSADRSGSMRALLTRSFGSMQLYAEASPRGGGQTSLVDDSDALSALAPSPHEGVSSMVFTGTLDSHFARSGGLPPSPVFSGTLDSQFARSGGLPPPAAVTATLDSRFARAGGVPGLPCVGQVSRMEAAAPPFFDSIAQDVGWAAAPVGGGFVVGFWEGGSACGSVALAGEGAKVGCVGASGDGSGGGWGEGVEVGQGSVLHGVKLCPHSTSEVNGINARVQVSDGGGLDEPVAAAGTPPAGDRRRGLGRMFGCMAVA